ncbi:MAG: glycosyl hydrolase family 18 protein [Candidatus Izemoplasmatales bacterium]
MIRKIIFSIAIIAISISFYGCHLTNDATTSITTSTTSYSDTSTSTTTSTVSITSSSTETINYTISFDSVGGSNVSSIIKENGESIDLPTCTKEGYIFVGWTLTNTPDAETIISPYTITSDITLYAKWEAEDWSDVQNYLSQNIPSVLSSDIDLPKTFSEYTISWTSSHPDILNSMGEYLRPYQATLITLTATISIESRTHTESFEVQIEGYKPLTAPLASSYIYRDYYLVSDAFFTTLDIINCAFITADSEGNLSGTSVLANINTYIMPKAKENGNWVLFSIAPDSSWSSIAGSPTRVNNFADNIVAMINQYGFDGVDIDWETPTESEATKFTEMMHVIYTKVKENNPNHLVTAAVAGGMWQPPRYDLVNSQQYLDYINMMTYGMVSNNGYYQNALYKSTTNANTTNLVGKTLSSCSIAESVAIYNTYGIPNSKIIVGVAFYGIKQTRTYDAGSGTWSAWTNAGSVSYTYIMNNYLNNSNYNYYYDSKAGVPYIISTDGTIFISFDNPRSIMDKSDYIINQGLGGMMYWENGLDSSGTLLLAMESSLKE